MQRPQQMLWQLLVVVGVCLVAVVETSAQAIEPTPLPPTQGLLVLQTGRVMFGRISGGPPFGYQVELPQGKIMIPVEHVQFQCEDLREAYLRLRGTVQADDVLGHVTLAKWCISYNRIDEARDELETALQLEPDREETRRLLARVNGGVEYIDPAGESPRKKRVFTLADTSTVESLGGLSPDLGAQFAKRIQPLLMNSCNTAGCHVPKGKREFELALVRNGVGVNRHTAEANLNAVIRQIDLAHPEESPLLQAAAGRHGVKGRPIFLGRKGEEQYRELHDWVLAVAAERRADRRPRDSERPVKERPSTVARIAEARPAPVEPVAPKTTLPTRPAE
ncbi:MAG TPA: hypothetical protein VHB77_08090, partial [Planctomycetaceae bacterium]|nr:hypothetical protein [Planctomycetaceae bacterium]